MSPPSQQIKAMQDSLRIKPLFNYKHIEMQVLLGTCMYNNTFVTKGILVDSIGGLLGVVMSTRLWYISPFGSTRELLPPFWQVQHLAYCKGFGQRCSYINVLLIIHSRDLVIL